MIRKICCFLRDLVSVEYESYREVEDAHQAAVERGRAFFATESIVTTAQEEHDLRLYVGEQR